MLIESANPRCRYQNASRSKDGRNDLWGGVEGKKKGGTNNWCDRDSSGEILQLTALSHSFQKSWGGEREEGLEEKGGKKRKIQETSNATLRTTLAT